MKKEKTNIWSIVSLLLAIAGLIGVLASVLMNTPWLSNVGFCFLIPGLLVSALLRYNTFAEENGLN